MNIRLATVSDIPAIMRIIRETVPLMRAAGNLQWDDTYPNPAVFEDDITLNQLWVAVFEDEIAGVIAITNEQYEEYAQVGWDITEEAIVTHRLVVSPRYRGKGIGEALLQQAEDEALRRKITLLRIDTNMQNIAAQKIFQKMGYQLAGEISLKFRPGMRFVCLEKKIK